MNPLISSIYGQLVSSSGSSSGVAKLKQDNSAFTIADGLVQRLLIALYSHVSFRDIVGEEEEDGGKSVGWEDGELWFEVQGLSVPNDLRQLVESTKADVQSLMGWCSGG